MTFNFLDLNNETRDLMQDELVFDINSGQLYKSSRFNQKGNDNWAEYLSEAMAENNEDWLSEKLRENVFDEYEMRKTGRAKIPVNAAELLAQSEFNQFYMRAICRKAKNNEVQVSVYRAKESLNPRPDSEDKIGAIFDPDTLLADLRANKNIETILGMARPNSGLSIRIED